MGLDIKENQSKRNKERVIMIKSRKITLALEKI